LDKPASIFKLPSPILVKSPKEINKSSKYFKKNKDKKEQKNHILKLLYILTSLEKFWKSKKHSPNYRTKKLKTYKKSLGVRTNPNLS